MLISDGAIANFRYVVIGESQKGRRAPIAVTDDEKEARTLIRRSVDGVLWKAVRVHDRRTEGLVPEGGWYA